MYAAHARHDPHVDDDVGTVGQLDADMRDRAAQRAHGERHDVKRPPAHAVREESVQRAPHVRGCHPVIGRAGVVPRFAADERAVLDPRDVGRIRAGEVAAGAPDRIEPGQRAGGDHLGAQAIVFGLAAVAPKDAVRARQRGDLAHPAHEPGVPHIGRCAYRSGKRGQRFRLVHRGVWTVARELLLRCLQANRGHQGCAAVTVDFTPPNATGALVGRPYRLYCRRVATMNRRRKGNSVHPSALAG